MLSTWRAGPLSTSASLARSISEAFQKKGFSFIEVISPCPTLYQRRNKLGDGLETMKYYKEKSKTKHGAPTSECGLTLNGEIIVGKFVDRDRLDYGSLLKAQMHESLGEKYVDYDEEEGLACGTDGGCEEESCH